jgi:hypothetical protein
MIIGAPRNITDFQPLEPHEFQHVATPVIQALQQGADPGMQAAVDFGVLCRLLVTVQMFALRVDALEKEVATLKEPPPLPNLASLGTPVEVERADEG